MKKKLISLLLAIIMVVSLLPVSVSAAAQKISDSDVTWELSNNDTVLTIDGTGDMPDFKNGYGSPWISSSSSITTIEIGANVTKIGKYAFISCAGVSDVNALSVTPPTLGGSIFNVNENLKIHVPAASVDQYKSSWSSYAGYIEASQASDTYAITNGTPESAKETNHGYIAIDKTTAAEGETVTITVKPNKGYQLKSLTVTPVECVEIGGVKWATKNLGAEKETDYGDYFAWGETAPYYEGTGGWPATPTWKSGKASGYVWQSYCGSSGFTEWSTPPYDATTKILKPEFDAATQILGNGWRMPTSAEFKALYDACGGSFDKTTNPGKDTSVGKGVYWCTNYDGVAGCLFCDGTNKLFFPAAGSGYETSHTYANSHGNYWSSSLGSDTFQAFYLYFRDIRFYSNTGTQRSDGYAVRPVMNFSGITTAKQQDGTYQFTMPGYPVTVTATFEAATEKPVDKTLYWGFDDSTKTLYLSKTAEAITGATPYSFSSTYVFGTTGDGTSPWYDNRKDVESVQILNSIVPGNTACWFYEMENLTGITGIENLDTSNVVYMEGMFHGCSKLATLDVSGFDTSNVTDMMGMFSGCSALATLDVSGFDTSNVTDMSHMFNGCEALETLNLSSFDTSNVTDMNFMFSVCAALTTLDVSKFDTSKVTNMEQMFSGCKKLETLDLKNFNTSNVTNMMGMFAGDRSSVVETNSSLKALDLSSFDTSKVTDMSYMFSYCDKLTTLNLSSFNTSKVTDMSRMFEQCNKLTELDVSKFDTSKVTNMAYMFTVCSTLTTLDVSSFNTSKVTDMSGMFNGCRELATLDLSKFDTSKVTDMRAMFLHCLKLTTLDISSFTTASVTSMSSMFNSCSALTSLDLSNFDTSKVENMSSMFKSCTALTSLDLSNFDTSKVTSMGSMFYSCKALASLDLSNFDTSKVEDMSSMFKSCSALTSLDLSGFDMTSVTSADSMFAGAGVTYLKTPKNLKIDVALPTLAEPMKWHYAADVTLYNGTNLPKQATSIALIAGIPVQTWSALQDAINEAPGDATTPATATTNIILKNDLTAPAEGGASVTIPAGKDITLNLNGKVLNANGGAFSAVTVEEGGKLTVIDSTPSAEHKGYVDANGLWHWDENGTHALLTGETAKTISGGVITGGIGANGGGVFSKGTLTMNGGAIAGNTASFGGGVYAYKGTFTMNDGTIVGNATTESSGGGVYVNEGTFTMNGGTIADNTGKNGGGGVSVDPAGIFTMNDGVITGNKTRMGGGVINGGTFTMIGGEITGNTATSNGGGVYHLGTLTLGGTAKITDNTEGEEGSKITSNLYLRKGKLITVGTKTASGDGNGVAAPASGFAVGVTTQTAPKADTPVRITENGTADDVEYFTSDNADYCVNFVDAETDYLELKEVRIVAAGWSDLQDAINKAPGNESAPATETTNIQLTGDLTAPAEGGASVTIPAGKDITLDLCGHVLSANGGAFSALRVEEGGKLTVIDSTPSAEHKGYVDANGLWHWDENGTHALLTGETAKTISGGVITGGTGYGSKYLGGGVNTAGALTLNGGTICGNTSNFGGGVYVAAGSTFNLYSGTICANTAKSGGGGISCNKGGDTTVYGGTICDNTVTVWCGGGIQNEGTLKLLAAEGKEITITGNTATVADGGVGNWGEMHLSGKVIIKDNICTAKYDETVNYPINLATNQTITIDGALTGSEIYITHANFDDDKHNTGILTTGFTAQNPGAKLGDFFTYDGTENFEMLLNESGENAGELEVTELSGAHLAAKVIDAICGKEQGSIPGVITVDDSEIPGVRTVTLLKDVDLGEENLTVANNVFLDLNHFNLTTTGTITNNGTIILYNENADAIGDLLAEAPGNYAAGEELKLPNAASPEYVIPADTFMTLEEGTDPAYRAFGFAIGDDPLVWNGNIPAGMQLDVTYTLWLGGDILASRVDGVKDTNVTAVNFKLNDNITIGSNTETDGGAALNVLSIYDDLFGDTLSSFDANGKTITLNKTGKLVVSSDASGFDESVLVPGVQGMSIVKTEDKTAKTVTYSIALLPPAEGEGFTIDYAEETLTVLDGYEVSTADGEAFESGMLSPDGDGRIAILPGTTYFIRKAAIPGSVPASETTVLSVSARPAAPKAPVLESKTDVSLTVSAVKGQEYSIDGGNTWISDGGEGDGDITSGTVTFTDLEQNTDYSIVTRTKAVTEASIEQFAGEISSPSTGLTYAVNEFVKEESYAITTPSSVKNGKIEVNPKNATVGQTVWVTVTPEKGYEEDTLIVLDGKGREVALQNLGNGLFCFAMPNGKVSISAAFKPVPTSECPRGKTCPLTGFNDLGKTQWYHDGIHFCLEKGLLNGMGNGKFDPNGSMTRAMTVTMLWRLEGEPVVNYAMSFKDVKADLWYTEAIRWAESTGIVKGYSAESFGPNDPITREQMAEILYRFAKNHGIDVKNANTLTGFTDAAEVSSWALDAMKWANAVGLVQGRTASTLVPKMSVTRAEAAAMVQRYCESDKK